LPRLTAAAGVSADEKGERVKRSVASAAGCSGP